MTTKQCWTMKELHRNVLIKRRLKLAENLCLEALLQYLVQENVISDRMVEKIQYQPTTFSRNVAFLSILPKRGPKAYEIFKQALQESGQSYLSDMLGDAEAEITGAADIRCIARLSSTEHCSEALKNTCPANNGLDLRDGQHDLYVTNTTVDVFERTQLDAYKMTSKPRGLALLVNISVFGQGTNLLQREGSDIDQKNLIKLLHQLYFDTTVVENCSGHEMVQHLEKFSQNTKHLHKDCTVVAILSHGAQNFVYGSDGEKVELSKVLRMFDNERCPFLQNKPKIFLIQACREFLQDVPDGPPITTDNGLVEQFQELGKCLNNKNERLPTMSDMIIGNACLPGTSALRNTRHGSWYIQGFVKMMANHAKDMEITEILTLVNDFVRRKISSSSDGCQPSYHGTPEFVSTLCKKLFFYPGMVEKIPSSVVGS